MFGIVCQVLTILVLVTIMGLLVKLLLWDDIKIMYTYKTWNYPQIACGIFIHCLLSMAFLMLYVMLGQLYNVVAHELHDDCSSCVYEKVDINNCRYRHINGKYVEIDPANNFYYRWLYCTRDKNVGLFSQCFRDTSTK